MPCVIFVAFSTERVASTLKIRLVSRNGHSIDTAV